MSYSYNSTTQMPNTSMNTAMNTLNSMSSAGTMMVGTLGANGTVNSYFTGGGNSIFDTQLKAQETNQALTAQSMKNNYDNNYQGSVFAASSEACYAECKKIASDMDILSSSGDIDTVYQKWFVDFPKAVVKNPIIAQAINISDSDEVKAMCESVFQQLTGYTIVEFIKNKLDDNFMNGAKGGCSFGAWGSKITKSEFLAALGEGEARTSSYISEGFGGTVGGALGGAAVSMVGTGLINATVSIFGGEGKEVPIATSNLGKIATGFAIGGALIGCASTVIRMCQSDATNS